MNGHPDGGYGDYPARSAARWPDRTALHFEGDTWTYAAFNEAVEQAAHRLVVAGITADDRVALLVENCPEYLIAQFAVARLGAAFVTPNPYWTEPEVSHAVTVGGATAIVHAAPWHEVAASFPTAVRFDTLLDAAPQKPLDGRFAPESVRYIPFSSGTTGLPKGVVHTDASLCGGVEQLRHHLALTADDRLQIALPLCHTFGATMCAAALSVGAEMTLFRRFDLDDALRHIASEQVTIWPMAGAVAHQLAEREVLRPEDFSSLRLFMWGGSAVPVALAERITERTGVRFLCSYGMTEAMMVAFNPVEEPERWSLESPGYATRGTEIHLAVTGELEVRGPSVAAGYAGIDSPDFGDDGWFRTGDLATIDADGRLRIVDRVKDVLKVSGFQVAPTEVELALQQHPDVNEAAVVGCSDDRAGQAVVAFVVGSTDGATLNEWVATRIATYKRPREYNFVAALPRTAGGKVRRNELRAWASGDGSVDHPISS